MSKKNLSIDKERLVRLQDAQAQAATGGEGPGSTDVKVEVEMLSAGPQNNAIGGTTQNASVSDSCCSKSCR